MFETFRNALDLRVVNHILASALFSIAFAADHGVTVDGSAIPPGNILWMFGLLAYFGAAFMVIGVIWLALPLEWDAPLGAIALVFAAIGIASTLGMPGTEVVRSTFSLHPFWFVGALVCGRYLVENYVDARRLGIL